MLLLPLGYTPNTTTTLHEYHGSGVDTMDHANLRRNHPPEEYDSSLLCLGPIYQTDSNRPDEAVAGSYSYAQSAFAAPDGSRTPLRPGAKNGFAPQDIHNVISVSKRRVSEPP